MAYVKTGKDLENEQDLQNLVIGILNRMPGIKKNFRAEDVVKLVKHFSYGAQFSITDKMIRQRVSHTLDLYYIRNKISCSNGMYHFLPLKLFWEI